MAKTIKKLPSSPKSIFDNLSRFVPNHGGRRKNPKAVAGSRQAWARRNKERYERAQAQWALDHPKREWKHPPPGERISDRAILTMTPGEWYAAVDVMRAIGKDPQSTATEIFNRMRERELVERRPFQSKHDSEWPIEWLYRLTAKGEAMRELSGLLQ